MKRLRLWLRALCRPSSVEADLKDEFLHHLEMEVLKNLRSGMPENEARRKAMVDFGGVDRFMEQTRETRATRPLEDWWADFRRALRGLRASPGFTAVTVFTLAIGIGANSAIFSVVSGVLLKPLPYHEAENLVFINSFWTSESGYDLAEYPVGSPEYFDYRNQNRSLESLAAVSTELMTVTEGDGDPEVVPAGWVSPNLFALLRTQPLLGRTLVEGDGGAEPSRVVVLSYDLWQRRFGGDEAIVGRRISLGMTNSGGPVGAEIVGVMPAGFEFPRKGTQLWGPLPLDPSRTWRGGHWFTMVGRLDEDVSFEDAQAEMANLMDRWAVTYPDHHVGHGLQMRPLLEEEVGRARPVLLLLLASVGLVLLIACANVASLLLARGEERRREFSVRSALGASRGRLLKQGLTESLILAASGGGLGLIFASAGIKGLLALEAGAIPRVDEISLDLNVLAFTGVAVIVTTVLFGLAPAFREARSNPADALKEGGRSATGTGNLVRFRKGLVVAEIGFSVFLVVGAGLLIRSFQGLLSENPGFNTQNLHFASFSLPAGAYPPEGAVIFFDELLNRTRALSNVSQATLLNRPPMLWEDQSGRFHIEGRPAAPTGPLCCLADPISVGDGFFETMGVSIVRGRTLTAEDHDIDADLVVVVDEAAAAQWWPGEDPIGGRIRMGSEEGPWMRVVGVAENITFDGPGQEWPHVYAPHNPTARSLPFVTSSTYLTVRTTQDSRSVAPEIRTLARELDGDLAVANTYSMAEIRRSAVARPRFVMSVLSVFGLVALALGAIGVYGVISYSVAVRAPEIGIRRAVGADAGEITLMILRQGLALALFGLALGLTAAAGATRLFTGFLHEVSPVDPVTFLLVGVGTMLVAFLASYIPARRAGGVDPLVALRVE